MSSQDGGDVLLYCGIDGHDHDATCLQPLEGCIIFLFKLPVNLIYCKNKSATDGGIHLGPNRGEDVRWILAKKVQNAAGVKAVGHYSPWPVSSEPL